MIKIEASCLAIHFPHWQTALDCICNTREVQIHSDVLTFVIPIHNTTWTCTLIRFNFILCDISVKHKQQKNRSAFELLGTTYSNKPDWVPLKYASIYFEIQWYIRE